MKHNKKRNTAFIYEALVREFTKTLVGKDSIRRAEVVYIMKEHFAKGSGLASELSLYNILLETKNIKDTLAERLLQETKNAHVALDEKRIFDAQSSIIAAINKNLGPGVWSNFVPNFKTLASINSVFNPKASVKQRVLFEQSLVDRMSQHDSASPQDLKSIDNLTYHSFIKKFNQRYNILLQEQKDFLNKYITSFADEGFELRVYLNEEITRLKSLISTTVDDDNADTLIREKSTEVVKYLDSFRKREFGAPDLTKILKTQELVRELTAHD
jgi:hypothetical protein